MTSVTITLPAHMSPKVAQSYFWLVDRDRSVQMRILPDGTARLTEHSTTALEVIQEN